MIKILNVYFGSQLAGKLIQEQNRSMSFQYESEYASNKHAYPISVSMPVHTEIYEGDIPKAFFSGLLPDDIIRQRLARYLGLSEKNSFALLEVVGGECAGALSLYPESETLPPAKEEDIQLLDEQSLKGILDLLKRRPLLAGNDDIRLSLAGAQDKIAVGLVGNSIALVKGSTPTTHILKPLIDGIKDSVHNEIFCMRLAKLLKIDVPNVEIRWVDDTPYYLVERYDRIKDKENNIARLHQEDFCQALTIMPEFKYEREGGPSIEKSLNLLQTSTLQPAVDRLAFIKRLIFNYLIGNADAHGKNHSLLFKTKVPVLAPAYDLFCTAIYPELSAKMAMRIGKEYLPDKIFLRHWHKIIPDTSTAKKALAKELQQMSNNSVKKSQELKQRLAEEGIESLIFNDICAVIKKHAEHIKIMTEQ